MSLATFWALCTATHASGHATEHSYRPALTALLNSLASDLIVINEPKRIACGAPDFIIQRGELVIGHVEAKDIPIDLTALDIKNRAQQQRYCLALPNLIYTNCLEWQFFRDGQLKTAVVIGTLQRGVLTAQPDQFAVLANLLQDFIQQRPLTITSPRELAERMAGKAVLIKNVLFETLKTDPDQRTELAQQFAAFQQHLVADITPDEFANLYAETIAYGLFAARIHSAQPQQFNRQQALTLLPKSNPFLRALFGYIAGAELDERIAWIIDELASIFQVTDLSQVLAGFGQFTGQTDPVIHFYETFLSVYDPAKRKARGVWYTPEPVVNFIVRAVDAVLKTEFGLIDGLADTARVNIDFDTGQTDADGAPITIKKDVHRVQILDPATGTGTFLAAVIKQIAPHIKGVAPGLWARYIEADLIPRLHGFELLMASYAMCHLKLDLLLTELGYVPTGAPPRLSVYLTNSLEAGSAIHQQLPFAQWLSNEARGANVVKRNLPIMCVIGNPPYSGESVNKSDWIMRLMETYKTEPGGRDKLQERNPKWINDDYVKFIRLSEHLISKNGEGVLGFITNHGYLDNPTFRGMRWQLLNTFDTIYVLDLHGNAKKKEVTPAGQPDKNVFDIQQGVAILIAVKRKIDAEHKPLATVFHSDLWGERADKYAALWTVELTDQRWQSLAYTPPQYVFVRRDNTQLAAYQAGFSVQELMPVNSVGIVTARDSLTIDMDKMALWRRVQDFAALPVEQARIKYDLGKDVRDWRVEWAQNDVKTHLSIERVVPIAYRPFDYRWTYYTGKSRGFICYPRSDVMAHLFQQQNISFMICAQHKTPNGFHHVLIHAGIAESSFVSNKTSEIGYAFPLYFYFDRQLTAQPRRVNFNPDLYQRIQSLATDTEHGTPDELAVFDYIYGVLHCPAYRNTYAELLKADFPRIPWPPSPTEFWSIAAKGEQLRRLHLMEPAAIGNTPYPFIGDGAPVIDKPRYEHGNVWINSTQYFADVPAVAWTFYIGGYQPAQKWLKDRRGRELTFEDIKHYQRVIKILSETERVMGTIAMAIH